jgi:hypothetical protein
MATTRLSETGMLTLRDVAQAALDLDAEDRSTVTWKDLADRAKAWATKRQTPPHQDNQPQPAAT